MRQQAFFLLILLLSAACGPVKTVETTPPTAVPPTSSSSVAETAVPPTDSPTAAETAVSPTNEPTGTETAVPAQPEVIDLDVIPEVDTAMHSVPLTEIYFDTFRPVNRAVPLSDADPGLIRQLRDAIPPIYNPVFESAAEADGWLSDNNLILGYADGDAAFAYPIRILNFHEIVSHEVNGRAVVATYCPLCRSGVMYDRSVNGDVLLFGNTSALYESDMVMLDHQTGSYWVQVSGEAVVGPLTGSRLTVLPSQTTTWGLWKEQHPETLSLSRDTGYSRDYSRNPFLGYRESINRSGRFAFPVSEAGRDPRLDPGALVLGVEIGNITRAYPLEPVDNGVINDAVGETAVVIFVKGAAGAAYSPVVDSQTLTFTYSNGTFVDDQTGTTWNLAGKALSGDLAGTQLEPLPSRSTLWFALIATFPELSLYTGE